MALASNAPGHAVVRPTPGPDNTIAFVDDAWVIRIADSDDARNCFENELATLRYLAPRCRVPNPIATNGMGMVYPIIPGAPLRPLGFRSLDARAREQVVRQIGSVLRELHAMPLQLLPDPLDVLDERWARDGIASALQIEPRHPLGFDPGDLLARFEAAWALGDAPTTVVHADLKPSNIVIDGDNASVIDFGGICVGDPAIDYGLLTHHFGDDMLEALEITDTPLAARARCYAQLYHLRRCTKGWTRSAPRYRAIR